MSAEMTQEEIDAMLNAMASGGDPLASAPATTSAQPAAATAQPAAAASAPAADDSGSGLSQAEIDAMLSGNAPASSAPATTSTPSPKVDSPVTSGDGAANMAFQSLGNVGGPRANHDVSMIMDVPLELTVELGRTNMFIKDILDLGPGSVVEINRLAGEPIELLVNGKVIAKGEVVVIDERFGIRITQLLNPVSEANPN